ncbi:MAG: permease prefix domain 1-containing protein, partial [Candidatus Sulfotelmatobacter sp.]
HWTALVRERLGTLNLPAKHRQEVIAELAAHLEDLFEERLQNGLTESEARHIVMSEVEWRALAKTIQHLKSQEETMNPRTKHVWLPGLVSLTAAMVLLTPLIATSMQPRFLGLSPLQMVFLPWIALLPLCGAAGAYLSRRGGGNRRERLVAGLFPTIALFTLGSILVPTRLLTFARPEWRYGLVALVIGIILPSASLLLGTMPFLREPSQCGSDIPVQRV